MEISWVEFKRKRFPFKLVGVLFLVSEGSITSIGLVILFEMFRSNKRRDEKESRPSMTEEATASPLPALSCEARVSSLCCFSCRSEFILQRMRICGRQFLVCGGPSSRRRRLKRAALSARPRMPSPHSFSALLAPSIASFVTRHSVQCNWIDGSFRIIEYSFQDTVESGYIIHGIYDPARIFTL